MYKFVASASLALVLLASCISFAPSAAAPAPSTNFASAADSVDLDKLADSVVTITVHVGAEQVSHGTGFICHGKDGTTYLWTAAHVVGHTRTENNKFSGELIVERSIRNAKGHIVGYNRFNAELLKYSHCVDDKNDRTEKRGKDLAILRLPKRKRLGTSARLCSETKPLKIGSRVWHMGSFLGSDPGPVLTEGMLSHTGVLYKGYNYLMFTVPASGGSSGGPLVRKTDGCVVAMLNRGRDAMFVLATPAWEMRAWADKVGAAYAYDNTKDYVASPQIEEVYDS